MNKFARIITKNDLQTEIDRELNNSISIKNISDVLNTLEIVCKSYLKKATPENPINIRLMDGLYLRSELLPEAEISSFNGKPCVRTERLRATAKFTRYFNRRCLNNLGY